MTATCKRSLSLIGALALAATATSALAEVWIETSRTDDYLAYADPSSVRRDGDLVKMWSMFDYRNPQSGIPGKPFLSTRRQFEYDCKRGRARALAVSSHAARQGKGDALASVNVKYDWRAVVPQSADDYLLKFACKKFDGK